MTRPEFDMSGRRALVTGAAGGIGGAVARAFAGLGCRVAAADLDREAVSRVAAALPDQSGGHVALGFDLGDSRACESSVEEAATRLGGLDIVVHAGAMMIRQPTDEVTMETLARTTAVNMWGSFFVARRAAQLMAAAEGGSIILFSSIGAYTGGHVNSAAYSMTKAAVTALVKSLAREYAARRVRINGIAPGAVDTRMLRDGVSTEALASFMAMIPMKRAAEPDELASCCVFLASGASAYVTGQMLHVNGGQMML
ncbi:MAG: SDR family NAD(P)-dependent oxidoreductase [Steroidobacteraceae bacterium]